MTLHGADKREKREWVLANHRLAGNIPNETAHTKKPIAPRAYFESTPTHDAFAAAA